MKPLGISSHFGLVTAPAISSSISTPRSRSSPAPPVMGPC